MSEYRCWVCTTPMEICNGTLLCPTCEAQCRLSNSQCKLCSEYVWVVDDIGRLAEQLLEQGAPWSQPGTFWCLKCDCWDCRVEDLTPSKNTSERWIYARGVGKGCYQGGQTYVGKWLIFVPRANVDEVWERIRQASENGQLGIEAKVSTSYPSGYKSTDHVICIYTYDFRDKANVGKVLAKLREIGIQGRLFYKTDQATLNGLYAVEGPATKKRGPSSLYSSDDFEK
jgi:hypothetical protein